MLHQNDRKAAQLQRIACWTRNNGCITVSPASPFLFLDSIFNTLHFLFSKFLKNCFIIFYLLVLEDGPGDKGSIPQKDIGEFQYSDDYYKDSSKKDKYGNVTHNKRVYTTNASR